MPPLLSICALVVHFCQTHTEASSTADFFPTIKAELRHESVDTKEDRVLRVPSGTGPSYASYSGYTAERFV